MGAEQAGGPLLAHDENAPKEEKRGKAPALQRVVS